MKIGYLAAALLVAFFGDRLFFDGRYVRASMSVMSDVAAQDWTWSR